MENHGITSPWQACTDIILKPNRVFAKLQDTANWSWLPFIIVTFFSILPVYLYFSMIDFQWYTELVINAQYADISPSEQDMIRSNMQQEQMLTLTVFSTLIGLILLNAVQAFYLYKITQIDDQNTHSYGDWYGFTWWISLPVVLTAIIALIMIQLFGGAQMPPSDINPTSLAYLLNIEMSSDWYGLAQTVRIESFWAAYLAAVGISQWTRLNSKQCYIIALAPLAIIWGVWTLFIVF
ncbi:MAG: Yip1 family protein [Aestuariibacter sp.]